MRETALYFEAAMMDDDNSSRLRLSQSTELARLKQVQLDLAKSDARLQVAQKHSTKIAASLAETNDQVSEIMIAIGLPQSTDLEFLTHWLEKRDYAFRRIIEFSIQKADFDAYEKQRLDALSMLQNSMRDTGIFSSSKTNQSENLQALIGLGQKAVSDWRNDVLLRDRAGQSHNDANAELKRRQKYSDHGTRSKRSGMQIGSRHCPGHGWRVPSQTRLNIFFNYWKIWMGALLILIN